ncbi:DUF4199 domain-containing protein [Mucilaginibacter sp. BJC16-A38]|uniref:DUF4199 domain-containing protein n=1 Tax=Mucilaginibacter phenanthrenivorans TaxID=1234842 RepID=UPI0021580F01|nr:DUF4199 domain-containing protein [Mucilaginibacter phenanthrenivorans]MCR8557617.1 DUF4199 domain-containing protein [Mucilaginibacter phenanthrenivorans]
MKRNVLVFGSIAGGLVSLEIIIGTALCYKSGTFEGNMLVGYTTMLLAFSLEFVGVKNYRDKYNGGIITFGKAFKIAILIALVASTMYVVVWVIEYYLFIPDFMDKYSAHVISKARASGASAADIDAKVKQVATMKKMYSTPVGVVLLTYMEIFPIGLIVSIITALVLKRKANNDNVVAAS